MLRFGDYARIIGLGLAMACAAQAADQRSAAPDLCTAEEGGATAALSSLVTSDTAIPAGADRDSIVSGAGCRIDASALISGKSHAVLVDVRPSSAFSTAWIPGAANLSLEAVSTNVLVKASNTVVLIGNGKDTVRLQQRCTDLHKRGLSQLRVLDGGLPAWLRAGGAVVGNVAAIDQPLLLDGRELHEVLQQPGAVLVFAEGRPTLALAAAGARIVKASAKNALSKAVLGRIPRAMAKETAAVIFLPSSGNPAAWRASARSMGLPDPLFFVGDASRYDAYLQQQARIAASANKPRSSACERG